MGQSPPTVTGSLSSMKEAGVSTGISLPGAEIMTPHFAIPSPARRESGNWVLEPVPILDSREARKRAAEDKAA
jgi:hypothetical protein